MLKGVNKRVVEIKGKPDSYFEKAILFIRPNYSEESLLNISLSAEEYLSKAVFSKNQKAGYFKKIGTFIGIFAAGCILTGCAFWLITLISH